MCVPQCAGKNCGDDGCGSVCGNLSGPNCHHIDCVNGVIVITPIPGCCTPATDCNDGNPCTTDACDASGTCQHSPLAEGTPCGGSRICDATGRCVECISDQSCDDGNPCTANSCQNGTCQHPPLPAGTACIATPDTPVCDGAGTCVRCVTAADCDDGDPCHTPRCEPNSHTCAYATALPDGTRCLGIGTCQGGACHPCLAASAPCPSNDRCCDFYTGTGQCYLNSCCFNPQHVCLTDLQCCLLPCTEVAPGTRRCCLPAGQTCSQGFGWCCNTCQNGRCT
jgi:hypothetical protein